jgi:hypothetical protein
MVLTPESGDATTTSWPFRRSLFTTFEPMRPLPSDNDDLHGLSSSFNARLGLLM